ncbi:uncharacterized protein LOC125662264 [Ostrea edulis]|uniref:uncharacterized protein LOC125662264 n=1 Tax=Ostrea edulis TaxID=37623 RepID=UPI0024AED7FF|nr:uncharacterized protein LOC125662264 [Ostrea edulis]
METFRACAIMLVSILAIDAKAFQEVRLLTPLRFRLLQNGNGQITGKVGIDGKQKIEMHLKSSKGQCNCPGSYRQNCACVDEIVYFQNPSKHDILVPNHDDKGVESAVNKRQGEWFDALQKRQSYRHHTMIENSMAEPENILEFMIGLHGDPFIKHLNENYPDLYQGRPANS